MPLPRQIIAITSAVLGFFVLGLVSASAGVCPSTCCRRAVIGSVLIYFAASTVVGIINGILTHAMISSQLSKDKAGVDRS